jgi:hypothetical protein
MSFLSREEGRREKVIHRLESPWGECVIETVPDGMPTFPLQLIVSHHILNELTRQFRNLQTSHRRREARKGEPLHLSKYNWRYSTEVRWLPRGHTEVRDSVGDGGKGFHRPP